MIVFVYIILEINNGIVYKVSSFSSVFNCVNLYNSNDFCCCCCLIQRFVLFCFVLCLKVRN